MGAPVVLFLRNGFKGRLFETFETWFSKAKLESLIPEPGSLDRWCHLEISHEAFDGKNFWSTHKKI